MSLSLPSAACNFPAGKNSTTGVLHCSTPGYGFNLPVLWGQAVYSRASRLRSNDPAAEQGWKKEQQQGVDMPMSPRPGGLLIMHHQMPAIRGRCAVIAIFVQLALWLDLTTAGLPRTSNAEFARNNYAQANAPIGILDVRSRAKTDWTMFRRYLSMPSHGRHQYATYPGAGPDSQSNSERQQLIRTADRIQSDHSRTYDDHRLAGLKVDNPVNKNLDGP